MKLAIMQPYFFPYLGYFQLINAVDTFVIYDDVNYIKQGWINRNRILMNKEPHFITLELIGSSSFKKINEIGLGKNKNKLIKTIDTYYRKAPNFKNAFPLIETILNYDEPNLSLFLSNSIKLICKELKIETTISISSQIEKDNSLKAQDKILDMCKRLNAGAYINAIGGTDLYSKEAFDEYHTDLKFISSNAFEYKQSTDMFYPNLSIIDVLMNNTFSKVQQELNNYKLI